MPRRKKLLSLLNLRTTLPPVAVVGSCFPLRIHCLWIAVVGKRAHRTLAGEATSHPGLFLALFLWAEAGGVALWAGLQVSHRTAVFQDETHPHFLHRWPRVSDGNVADGPCLSRHDDGSHPPALDYLSRLSQIHQSYCWLRMSSAAAWCWSLVSASQPTKHLTCAAGPCCWLQRFHGGKPRN